MSIKIEKEEVQRLIEAGAQLIEVLPTEEYENEHLPEAINIPLEQLDRQTTAALRQDRPVIVYCYDYQWDLSARAAARLESLGFMQVFRYAPGKADWAASRLPMEGKQAASPRAGVLARQDVPTCQLTDRLGEVRECVQAAGWKECIVVNDEGLVLGRLDQWALTADSEAVVEAVMESGPTTIRPSVPLDALAKHMQERKLNSMMVTTSDGGLVGVLYRKDVEQRVGNAAD